MTSSMRKTKKMSKLTHRWKHMSKKEKRKFDKIIAEHKKDIEKIITH